MRDKAAPYEAFDGREGVLPTLGDKVALEYQSLDEARHLHSKGKSDVALALVVRKFGIKWAPRPSSPGSALWPPAAPEREARTGHETDAGGAAEQLAALGVECCKRLGGERIREREWHTALHYAGLALQLCDCKPWRRRWRRCEVWAASRFAALRCASEALRGLGDDPGSLKASRDCLLECEEVLDAWPHRWWHPQDLQTHTCLAEVQWRLGDHAAALRSSWRALGLLAAAGRGAGAAGPSPSGAYTAVFVLWVLQGAALGGGCWLVAEAALCCARHLVCGVDRQDSQLKPCKRLLHKMLTQCKRHAAELCKAGPLQLHSDCPDLAWLLSLRPAASPHHAGRGAAAADGDGGGRDAMAGANDRPPPAGDAILGISPDSEEEMAPAAGGAASSAGPRGDGKAAEEDDAASVSASSVSESPSHAEVPQQLVARGAAPTTGGTLGRLRISTRYSAVDNSVSGFHKSSTMNLKMVAGEYAETTGQFSQKEYIKAMRTPPRLPEGEPPAELQCRELVVFRRTSALADDAGEDDGRKVFLQATLKGPASLVENWEATCDEFERNGGRQDKKMPFPVFIPSKGRARRAHLNWDAAHVFGPQHAGNGSREARAPRRPVVCVVVEPQEEAEYRAAWPSLLTLTLPHSGRGAGYARWAVQTLCTKAYVWTRGGGPGTTCGGTTASKRGGRWRMRKLPWVWVVDDSLSMFYYLRPIVDVTGKAPEPTPSGAQRLKNREAPLGSPMFLAAMLAVQRFALLPKAAVCGFLRDDGTAVCKRLDWKKDELSLYKVILLNLPQLKKLGVEYQQGLLMYEDICLNHDVLQSGGHSLKCQAYCFRASHSRQGGCAEQHHSERRSNGTQLEDLIAPAKFLALGEPRQKAVQEILEWVQSKEQWCARRSTETQPAIPSLATVKKWSNEKLEAERKQLEEFNAKRRAERDYRQEYRDRKKRKLAQEATPDEAPAERAPEEAGAKPPARGGGAPRPPSPSSN